MIRLAQKLGVEQTKTADSIEHLYTRKAELEKELEQVNQNIHMATGSLNAIKAVRNMIADRLTEDNKKAQEKQAKGICTKS